MLANQRTDKIECRGDDRVHLRDLRLQHLRAAEGEQLGRQSNRTRRRASNLPQRLRDEVRVAFQISLQERREAVDHGQQVVEVVRDPARQLSDRVQLLHLEKLRLDLLPIGDVLREDGEATIGTRVQPHPVPGAIRLVQRLELDHHLLAHRPLVMTPVDRLGHLGKRLDEHLPQQLFTCPLRLPGTLGIDVGEPSLAVERVKSVAHRLKDLLRARVRSTLGRHVVERHPNPPIRQREDPRRERPHRDALIAIDDITEVARLPTQRDLGKSRRELGLHRPRQDFAHRSAQNPLDRQPGRSLRRRIRVDQSHPGRISGVFQFPHD